MLKKIKSIFYISLLIIFIIFTVRFYLSDKNILKTNRAVLSYSVQNNLTQYDLPILKNDTDNIIDYKNDLEEFKNKRKKRIWESLISD